MASRSDFSQTNNQNTMSTYGIPDDELAMQQREAEDGYVHDLEKKLTAMTAERDEDRRLASYLKTLWLTDDGEYDAMLNAAGMPEFEHGDVLPNTCRVAMLIAERDTLALRVGVVETANADLAAERDALRTALDNLKP